MCNLTLFQVTESWFNLWHVNNLKLRDSHLSPLYQADNDGCPCYRRQRHSEGP